MSGHSFHIAAALRALASAVECRIKERPIVQVFDTHVDVYGPAMNANLMSNLIRGLQEIEIEVFEEDGKLFRMFVGRLLSSLRIRVITMAEGTDHIAAMVLGHQREEEK